MAYDIVVTTRFRKKLIKLLIYLEREWGKIVADNFLKKIDRRIQTLSKQPYIGQSANQDELSRSILVTKHNRLYYRIKINEIEILNLFDTRQNPSKNPLK